MTVTYKQCSRCRSTLNTDGTCRVCRHHPTAASAAMPAGPTTAQTAGVTGAAANRLFDVRTTTPARPGRPARRSDLARSGATLAAPPAGHHHAHNTDQRVSSNGAVPALSVDQLTKVYGEGGLRVTAVQDASFDIHDGEIVLIMGPSGSGKTTLLLMLGAMLRPTSGTVAIGGTDVGRTPERKLPSLRASHLGFVFQDFNLLSALSALENVEIACNLAGVRGEPAAARACYLLDRVGLWRRMNARPDQLSGGEKQRVAVARALANDPPLLLADEPTANLDSTNGREIGELLRRLSDEDGRTSLIVTHDERLMAIADRVLWLQDGILTAKKHR